MKLNSDIFHKFFYSENRGLDGGIQGRANVSYQGNSFYSYYTEIGHIITRKKEKALLISHNSLTSTTCAHIGKLSQACPFPYIPVPYNFNDNFTDEKSVIREMFRRMKNWINENADKLSRAENRYGMKQYIRSYRQLALFTGKKTPAKLAAVMTAAENTISAAEEKLKARRAELEKTAAARAAERAAADKKLLTENFPGWGIMEKAKAYFTRQYVRRAVEVHYALSRMICAYIGYSFVWYDNKNKEVRTSQCVTMSPDTAARAYKAFKAGKIQAGMHIGPYEVREITAGYVQIGCHKILMENIEQLAALMGWNA